MRSEVCPRHGCLVHVVRGLHGGRCGTPGKQYIEKSVNLSPTSSHLHPLHGRNSRLVVDEDVNDKFSPETDKIVKIIQLHTNLRFLQSDHM